MIIFLKLPIFLPLKFDSRFFCIPENKFIYLVRDTCWVMSPKWEKFETIRRPPSGVKEYWDVNEKLSHTPLIDSSSASYAPDVDQRGNLHLIGSLSSPIIAIIDLNKYFYI